jgi:mRNA-degrading endonuclease YafQ of YafQ-DinJ toxin-antitoxin module
LGIFISNLFINDCFRISIEENMADMNATKEEIQSETEKLKAEVEKLKEAHVKADLLKIYRDILKEHDVLKADLETKLNALKA